MNRLTTTYPEIYLSADYYHGDVITVKMALLEAQYDYANHPSATNWQRVEQAMFDYQHVKLNAKVESGGRAGIAYKE